jgi:5-methylcytosine-specific restriction endonuclease McrA
MSALQQPVLVLNTNWQPVHVATVARALVLVWKDAARIVDVADFQAFAWDDWARLRPREGDAFLRGASYRLRVPEVITLTSFDRQPVRSVTFSRRNIFKRDRFQCQYCGINPGSEELTIDHVLPRAQGGVSSWTNCVLACIECNKRKADRTPHQASMTLKRAPICPTWRPVYADHRVRLASWSKFISEAYWNVELET